MIEHISQYNCYKPFLKSSSYCGHEQCAIDKSKPSMTKVKIASAIGSGIGVLGAAYFISKRQSNKFKKAINLLNIRYKEPELLGVAMSSVVTGLAAGSIVDDKKHFKAKTREAIHQTLANIVAPLAIVGCANKIYGKFSDKIKLPQFKPTNSLKKVLNIAIQTAPSLAVTLAGLAAGVFWGTKLANVINNTSNTSNERKVKTLDFCYHPDDIATALVLADKTGKIQNSVSKIIPFVFLLHGIEAGSKR